MWHSLTYAPLFMHGEPEPSYSLHLFNDADRISLKEVETMEKLHQENALKRQLQYEYKSSRPYTCGKRFCTSHLSTITTELRESGATLPTHNESPNDLLIGAARRLNHIIDDRRMSWRVIPTASNKQYPTNEYLYPRKGEAYKMYTPPPAQNNVFTNISNNTRNTSSFSPKASFLRTQRDSSTSACHKENTSHSYTCTPKPIDGLMSRKSTPLMVVTSPKATQLNRLSIQLPTQKHIGTSLTPPTSRASRSKSLKSMNAWLETLPDIANIECVVSSTPVCKTASLETGLTTPSSLTDFSDEAKYLALSPGTSYNLTLSNECALQQMSE